MSVLRAKLFYLGFRAQSLRIRRAISFFMALGLEWEKNNPGLLERVMNGENLNFQIDFGTIVMDDTAVSQADRGSSNG